MDRAREEEEGRVSTAAAVPGGSEEVATAQFSTGVDPAQASSTGLETVQGSPGLQTVQGSPAEDDNLDGSSIVEERGGAVVRSGEGGAAVGSAEGTRAAVGSGEGDAASEVAGSDGPDGGPAAEVEFTIVSYKIIY